MTLSTYLRMSSTVHCHSLIFWPQSLVIGPLVPGSKFPSRNNRCRMKHCSPSRYTTQANRGSCARATAGAPPHSRANCAFQTDSMLSTEPPSIGWHANRSRKSRITISPSRTPYAVLNFLARSRIANILMPNDQDQSPATRKPLSAVYLRRNLPPRTSELHPFPSANSIAEATKAGEATSGEKSGGMAARSFM